MRLSRLADYGVVLLSYMAGSRRAVHNAQSLAAGTGVPMPTVSKVLFTLGRARLVIPVRGPGGGFKLARNAQDISVSEIVGAIDGPIALTQCIERGPGSCEVERFCPSRNGWQTINSAVRKALESVSVADLIAPDSTPWAVAARDPLPEGRHTEVAE